MKLKQKLQSVLLIDDDEVTNYIHGIIIKQTDCVENVVAIESGFEALEYLQTEVEGKYPNPDIIFLDINMPGMNGWEFLKAYENLPLACRAKFVFIMMTTNLSKFDKEAAKELTSIDAYKNKPMNEEMLHSLIAEYFPQHL